LVVNADPVARDRYRRVLQTFGCTVQEAASGVAAVVAARAESPDVIVMDMQLPDVPGQEAVEWLKALPGGRDTPVITVSWQDRDPALQSSTTGLVFSLSKPVSKRALRQAVSRALGGDGPGLLEDRKRNA